MAWGDDVSAWTERCIAARVADVPSRWTRQRCASNLTTCITRLPFALLTALSPLPLLTPRQALSFLLRLRSSQSLRAQAGRAVRLPLHTCCSTHLIYLPPSFALLCAASSALSGVAAHLAWADALAPLSRR